MSEKVAVRNVRLCEKDCLCLYVCPTGASDTENSVIDTEKCIGCGACADACPSRAISLVPREYPPQQTKTDEAISALRQLVGSKADQETIAAGLPGPLAEAIRKSNRIMAEDLLRESGYMLPQSGNAHALLEEMISHSQEPGFPIEAAEYLLSIQDDRMYFARIVNEFFDVFSGDRVELASRLFETCNPYMKNTIMKAIAHFRLDAFRQMYLSGATGNNQQHKIACIKALAEFGYEEDEQILQMAAKNRDSTSWLYAGHRVLCRSEISAVSVDAGKSD